MKTILVPLDGSALAEQVLASVRMLAPRMGAKVTLLHVVPETDRAQLALEFEPDDSQAPPRAPRADAWDTLRQTAERYLEQQVAQLRIAGVAATGEVQFGAPAEVIAAVAERVQAALIAMVTHGYSGLKRWALGSVTDKLVHATNIPVFVVRGQNPPPGGEPSIRRILVPLDGSALARQALPLAAQLAAQMYAELILLTVAVPSLLEAPELMSASPREGELSAELQEQIMAELGSQAEELRQRDIPVTPMAVSGFPADRIIDVAEREQADLIVMATHGYSGLKRWALGSVADKVLHAATTPLVLVRAQANAE
jgi:nucleotide-binding universal stress UspA family protein